MGKNELIGLNARLVFEKETDLKKAFRLLRKTGDSYIEEIVLKRKDNSVFWVLMCFRLENHFLFQEPQMLCQFININKEKSNTPIGKSNKDGLKAKLKKVIVNNKFQECIDELSKLFNDRDEKEILNTILAQESQLNLINRQQRLFTITNDEYNLTHSKIRKNLLDIIDEI